MRTLLLRPCLLHLWLCLAAVSPVIGDPSATGPDFDEVRDLVRAHLAGTSDADVNRASVDGLLHSLRGKVRLIGGEGGEPAASNAPALSKATVLDGRIACLRVAQVVATLPEEIRRSCQELAATNKLVGLVIDLRFAGGDDYAAAAATADLFVATQRPLLEWGAEKARSVEKADALDWPVAVLVNSETTGAAEALAAVLREAGVALILGGTTRGAAMTVQDFPLKNGQRLRIATSPVKLGDGAAISTAGVKPDIEVTVSPDAERAYQVDPYGATTRTNLVAASTTSATVTNRPSRRTRPNEADLVRARREGLSLDAEFPVSQDREPEAPVIRDPSLARAVDLLKGLAVVRRPRS